MNDMLQTTFFNTLPIRFASAALIIFLIACEPNKTGLYGTLENTEAWADEIHLLRIETPDDYYVGSPDLVIDTAQIRSDGSFHFPDFNTLDTQYVYRLNLSGKDDAPGIMNRDNETNSYVFLINDGKPLNITADANRLTRSYAINRAGGPFEKVRNQERKVFSLVDKYIPQLEELDTNKEPVETVLMAYQSELNKLLEEEISPYLISEFRTESDPRYLSLVMHHVGNYRSIVNDLEYVEESIERMQAHAPEHPYVEWWQQEVYEYKYVLPVGSEAPDIILKDSDDNIVRLSEMDGDLILIDFWASWCAPCRKENRETVKPLYTKYRNQGFNVYGVNLDLRKDIWLKAVAQDGITWQQVSDLMGQKSPVKELYKIEALPTTYLVDGEMKIVAKNLRGQDLEAFVEDYLN